MAPKNDGLENFPPQLAEYIRKVAKRIRFSRRVQREVIAELTDHFSQALRECDSDEDRQQRTDELIAQFGDASVLGALIRRGKKRCRPRWQKALIRTAQATGLFIVFMFVYGFWFISGEPTIRIDYLAQVNRNSRPSVSADQNAWPYYEKALNLYQKFPPDDSEIVAKWDRTRIWMPWVTTDSEYESRIRNWVDANKPAWAQFELATQKKYCWLTYSTGSDETELLSLSLFNTPIPPLHIFQKLGRLAAWLSWQDFKNGNMKKGLDRIVVYLRAGKHLNRPGSTLIEQLVGISVNNTGNKILGRALVYFEFSPQQLALIQTQLEQLYPDGFPQADYEFEKMIFLDVVQRCFTDGGPGGGHLLPEMSHPLFQAASTEEMRSIKTPSVVVGCMIHAGRDETLKLGRELFAKAQELSGYSPYQIKEMGLTDWPSTIYQKYGKYRYWLAGLLISSLEVSSEIAFRGKASHEATITILALKRRHMAKGEYPESLNELVAAGFLKEAPDDQFSAGSLVYRRAADDFILYSVSHNFTDDGGEATGDYNWSNEGDQIFWPLP